MESPLRFPGDFFYLRGQLQIALPPQQKSADPGPMLLGPSRLDDHAAQMRVPSFGNASSLDTIPAGILAGDQTAVAHQLPGTGEARQRAEFGNHGESGQLSDP